MADKTPIEVPVGFRLVNTLLVDARRLNKAQLFYTDTIQVLTENPPGIRTQGQIFNVDDLNGGFDEYWFKGGIGDNDLVLRSTGSGGNPIYDPEVSDTTQVPVAVGGVDAGTTAATLRGNDMGTVFDKIFFPTVEAEISAPASVTLTLSTGLRSVEIGFALAVTLTTSYNQGSIQNGNGTPGPSLYGPTVTPNGYTYSGAGIPTQTTSSNVHPVNIDAFLGSNRWEVIMAHEAGTGDYYDSTGAVGSNIDRSSGTLSDLTPAIQGYYARFTGIGYPIPTNSAEVRSLLTLSLDSNNTINLDTGAERISYLVLPPGRTLVRAFNNNTNSPITTDYTKNTSSITVEDPSGTPHNYTMYYAENADPYLGGNIITFTIG